MEDKIFRIIGRILAFPFWLALAIVGYFILLLRFMANYIRHGGEAITYYIDNKPKTISDVYDKLTELINNK